jgi:hypothetical protein
MEHAERSLPAPPLPDPPPVQWSGRDLLRFAAAHLAFLGACFAIGETVFLLLRQSSVYEIGPGREFPTLQAAETALSVAIARSWGAVGVFSMLVVLAVWLWKRSFHWFWIPLVMVPYVGPPPSTSKFLSPEQWCGSPAR